MPKNSEVLQKLMLGTDDKSTVEIEIDDNKYDFTIRPLTSGELVKLQSLEKKGFKVKVGMQNGRRQTVETNMNDIDVDVGEFNEAQSESMFTAIAWSLDVSLDEVKMLPTGIPEIIFEKVIEISNLSDNDLTVIKTFRKE